MGQKEKQAHHLGQGGKDQGNQVRQVGEPAEPVFPQLISNVLSSHLGGGDSARRSSEKLSTEVKNRYLVTQVWLYVLVVPLSAGVPWPCV